MTHDPKHNGRLVAAFYHFAQLPDAEARVEAYRVEAARRGLVGILLVAPEGVNGTLSGAPDQLRGFLDGLREDPLLTDLVHKESWTYDPPFRRLRVRLKKEIVSMGAPDIVSDETVAAYTPYDRWNEVIRTPGAVVIDVRNSYEISIGKFEGAIDPQTDSFREFPAWVEAHAEELKSAPVVAMYCTGGIRCEKAGALVRSIGVDNVFHLHGGILKYLEHVPEEDSTWEGGCFVFDERVSVGHGLEPMDHSLCRGCRRPLTKEDLASRSYRAGICCPHCAEEADNEQIRRREERQKQIALAKKRGERHLATSPSPALPAQFDAAKSEAEDA